MIWSLAAIGFVVLVFVFVVAFCRAAGRIVRERDED